MHHINRRENVAPGCRIRFNFFDELWNDGSFIHDALQFWSHVHAGRTHLAIKIDSCSLRMACNCLSRPEHRRHIFRSRRLSQHWRILLGTVAHQHIGQLLDFGGFQPRCISRARHRRSQIGKHGMRSKRLQPRLQFFRRRFLAQHILADVPNRRVLLDRISLARQSISRAGCQTVCRDLSAFWCSRTQGTWRSLGRNTLKDRG